jgi:hypothetical protein
LEALHFLDVDFVSETKHGFSVGFGLCETDFGTHISLSAARSDLLVSIY